MISVATAMLCKEQGITVTAICAVYEIFVIQKVSLLPGFFFFSSFQPQFSNKREATRKKTNNISYKHTRTSKKRVYYFQYGARIGNSWTNQTHTSTHFHAFLCVHIWGCKCVCVSLAHLMASHYPLVFLK